MSDHVSLQEEDLSHRSWLPLVLKTTVATCPISMVESATVADRPVVNSKRALTDYRDDHRVVFQFVMRTLSIYIYTGIYMDLKSMHMSHVYSINYVSNICLYSVVCL